MARNTLKQGLMANVDARKTSLRDQVPHAGIVDKDRPPHFSHVSREGRA